jgi:hypothetical protein
MGAGAIQTARQTRKSSPVRRGDGFQIVIVENAGDRKNADLASDAVGGDAAAFLGARCRAPVPRSDRRSRCRPGRRCACGAKVQLAAPPFIADNCLMETGIRGIVKR